MLYIGKKSGRTDCQQRLPLGNRMGEEDFHFSND